MTTATLPRRRVTAMSIRANDELLTVLDMCAELKVSRRTFYRWKAAGDVPDLIPLPGGDFRAYRSDFQAWLLNRTKGHGAR